MDDPACSDQVWDSCPPAPDASGRSSSKTLIIALVVALVGAALLFAIIVGVLLWCKKNERGFWKPAEKQDRDELSNFTLTQSKTYKGSVAAPSMTIGTLSILPTGGVEMTDASAASPASVQSVNNHTPVEDPTLPPHIKAYKDVKGNIFYVNSEDMTTSWRHPNQMDGDAAGDDGYGSGW
jgi:hypothetical protein